MKKIIWRSYKNDESYFENKKQQSSAIKRTNSSKKERISLKGSVMASEAFFPFRDNVDLAKKIGVSAIIQPGGSLNDNKIIDVADKHKLAMCFSHTRVFKH